MVAVRWCVSAALLPGAKLLEGGCRGLRRMLELPANRRVQALCCLPVNLHIQTAGRDEKRRPQMVSSLLGFRFASDIDTGLATGFDEILPTQQELREDVKLIALVCSKYITHDFLAFFL